MVVLRILLSALSRSQLSSLKLTDETIALYLKYDPK
jgi:hypothetical protein